MAVATKVHSELYRLYTFNNPNWNPAPGKPSSCLLARIGFYHVQTRDAVICAFCNITIDCCQLVCDPESLSHQCSGEHIRNMKLVDPCAVIHKFDTNPSLSRIAQPTTANLVSVRQLLQMLKEFNESIRQRALQTAVRINSEYNNPNPIDPSNPDFDRLRIESVRLSTFESWPSFAHADPVELANAGLFYTGFRDRVQCAFCREFLSSWRTTDVPSVEHRRRFPRCAFACGYDSGNVSMTTTLQGAQQSVVMPDNVHFQSHQHVNSRPSTSQELEWQQQRRQRAMVLAPVSVGSFRDDSTISHRHAGNSAQPGLVHAAAAADTHSGVIASATVDELAMTSPQAGDTGFDVSSELSALVSSVTTLPDTNTDLRVYPIHKNEIDTDLLLWELSVEAQERWRTGQSPFVMSSSSYYRLQPDVLQYKVTLRLPNAQQPFVKLLVVCAEPREHIITVTARVGLPGAPAVMSITPRHPDVRRCPLLMPDSSTRDGTSFPFNNFVPTAILLQRGAIIVIRVIFKSGHFDRAGDGLN